MASSTNKTKDWFKNQLISHGVALPSSSAKKEEYQRLYEEQVLPQQNNTEFSSDDDTEQQSIVEQPRAPSMSKSSRLETSKAVDGPGHYKWVSEMSDQNLFEALSACEKTPGPIVDSTREFYRRMLVEVLDEAPELTVHRIEVYLAENPDAKWEAGGLNLNGTNGVTNGNSENGFSDSDDEEHVETASRASRSSRASSKRTSTPARVARSPVKSATPPTPVSAHASSKIETESRRSARVVRENIFLNDDIAEDNAQDQDNDQLINRLSSPGGFRSKPYAIRKRMVESYEENRSYRDFDSETDSGTAQGNLAEPKAASKSKMRTALFILGVLILVGIVGFVLANQKMSESSAPEVIQDDLDELLKSLDEGMPNGDGEA